MSQGSLPLALPSSDEKKTMNPSTPSSEIVENCFGYVKLYSDGSIFREPNIKHNNNTIHDDGSSVWKDCLFDKTHDLYLRLYKPTNSINSNQKLQIIYYLHTGGFVFGSRSYPNAHNTCLSLCSGLQAVVVSPDFRLAPENRLPVALEDVYKSLKWMQDQALLCEGSGDFFEKWLCGDRVDFDRVFVFGDSSGGNLAHHLAVRLGFGSPELRPVTVRGYILLSPFFGGTVRTKSEIERPYEVFWSQEIYDQFWRLALPEGATTDDPMVNPFGPKSPGLKGLNLDPMLVLVGGDEVMKDRVEDYANRMKDLNHRVEYVDFKGKQHGFFTSFSYTEESKKVIQIVHGFIAKVTALSDALSDVVQSSNLHPCP